MITRIFYKIVHMILLEMTEPLFETNKIFYSLIAVQVMYGLKRVIYKCTR